MKKITTFLALLLTCIIGATAADFVPISGAKYLIKCKGDSKYVLWNSSCVKSATDNTIILSNWTQFDSRSLFSIEGDATTGYTIRSVKDNTQYVYAINTNNADGNVGVKAVSETPGDECVWKIVAQGDGWNIIPKNGEYSWNNRGGYNGNAHVGMWNSNASDNDIWYIKSVEDVMDDATNFTAGTGLGLIDENYANSVKTNVTDYKANQSEDALANLGALLAVNKTSYINLPTGYYRIKSCANDGNGKNFSVFDGTYLFTDIVNYPNVTKTLANVPFEEAKAKNNYVWKITRGELPSATVGIVNGQGKGVNNGTNYNTINLGLSDYYTTGAIYFTQGLHITNQDLHTVGGKEQNASAEATRSNPFTMTGWAHSDSKGSAYIFEPVSMDGVTAYTVNVTGAEGYVTLNSTNEVAKNGGFFLLSSAPQTADFTAATVPNYDAAVSINGNTINVNYTYNLAKIMELAHKALAKTGVGYPTANAATRTALKNAVKEGTDAAAIENALNAFKTSTDNIQMPKDGKAYRIKVPYISGTANYLYCDDTKVGNKANDESTNANEFVFVCHIVNGKYMFATNYGTYLSWADSGDGNKSYSTTAQTSTYIKQNDWTIEPATLDKGQGSVSLTDRADVFGFVQMKALGKDGTTNYYLNSRIDGDFISQYANDKFYDTGWNSMNRSCYYQFEEVEYPNTITFHDAQNINGVSHIATFSAPFATIIPTGVKAYYVSAKGTEATMTAIDAQAIPANQGVILTSETGTSVTMVPAADETAATISDNKLGHSAGATKTMIDGDGYILGNSADGTAFYPSKGGLLPMNKAYLPGNGVVSAIAMNFGNAVTGINTIAAPASAKALIFDLSGRRVVKATKGLYIQNGKKVIVK